LALLVRGVNLLIAEPSRIPGPVRSPQVGVVRFASGASGGNDVDGVDGVGGVVR